MSDSADSRFLRTPTEGQDVTKSYFPLSCGRPSSRPALWPFIAGMSCGVPIGMLLSLLVICLRFGVSR